MPPIKGLDNYQTIQKIKKFFNKKHPNDENYNSNTKILEMVQNSIFNLEIFEFLKNSLKFNKKKFMNCIENEKIELLIFGNVFLKCELIKNNYLFWDTKFTLENFEKTSNNLISEKLLKTFFEEGVLNIYDFWKEILFFQKRERALESQNEFLKDNENALLLYAYKVFDAILIYLENLVKKELKINV